MAGQMKHEKHEQQAVNTYIVLNVQITASLQQNAHNLDVALVGGQVQGSPAIL